MKVCTKCKVEKEVSNFNKSKNGKNGLNSVCKLCEREYRINNKDKRKQYDIDNKDKISEVRKKYDIDNKDKIKIQKNKYRNNKLKDPLFKLSHNTRSLITMLFRKGNYTKKSKTFEILGCSFEDFKIHLESQFTEGMTWSNQGLWHLDHITPISSAKTEKEVIMLNHYTNFQPLWAIDNFKKGNKLDYQIVRK